MTPQDVEMVEGEDPGIPLDFSEAAAGSLQRTAKMRGCVADDPVSLLRSSEEAEAEQIEDILAKFGEIGVRLGDARR